ncbi:hypothetical protein F5Y08DRAFT_322675 [Xylaria arbuscula]|nr:hypothetical protein F5Y08DRAFT_322675 [Xylaria arbuscula]
MGRPPAYIFVVRHGNRLDAADKQWHLSSPTPYDPPLTYGGWMHSRTVGARIAAILREAAEAEVREKSVDTTPEFLISRSTSSLSSPSPRRRRRRFRVVIHSSPFLRCVQTSVAISAGIASNPTASSSSPQSTDTLPSSTHRGILRSTQASSFSNPAPTKTRPDVPVPASVSLQDASKASRHIKKSVLRLDPFLGEWLSPDYFEHITPPPKSALMLATAKAELLRRSSYHDYPHFHARVHSSASSQLWGNLSSHHGVLGIPPVHGPHSISSLDTLSHLAGSLPDHLSHSHGHNSNEHADPKEARDAAQGSSHSSGYVYPVPSYALSTSEPIPKGYVAHARDACVSVDYQWDSSRETLEWGDGGTLPEEWASMHHRFRKGLRRLVDWYGSTEDAGEMVTKIANTSHQSKPSSTFDDEEEAEVEDVVVLVSHGAGCNALIGALTQQPVLADIAMSSLTVAKRRANFDPRNINLTREKSLTSLHAALPMSRATMPEMYELQLFANTDHLISSSPTGLGRSTSVGGPHPRARVSPSYTNALRDINFGSYYGSSSNGNGHSSNASLGSMRRRSGFPGSLVLGPSIYNANTGGITTRPDRSGSGTWGLWSPKLEEDEHEKDSDSPMFLDFSHEKTMKDKETKKASMKDEKSPNTVDANSPAYTTTKSDGRTSTTHKQNGTFEHHEEERDTFDVDSVPQLWGSSSGLWGAPRPPGEAERLRDFSSTKRRWTVTER